MPDQFTYFCEAAALGLLLGAYYDLFRALRAGCQIKKLTTVFITDALFWLTATICCLWFIFYYRWGEIYTFTYLGLALGAILYFLWLSPHLFKLMYRLCRGLVRAGISTGRALRRALEMLLFPAGRLFAGVRGGLKRIKSKGPARRIFRHFYRTNKE